MSPGIPVRVAVRNGESLVSDFEKICADGEAGAQNIGKAAKQLERAAMRLRRAIADGDHTRARSATAELHDSFTVLQSATRAVDDLWPLDDERVTKYLETQFRDDLIRAAHAEGVQISELDDRLAAFPILIQIQPAQRSIRIDRKRVTTLRPSRVVEQVASSRKASGSKPAQFIELLLRVYQRVADPSKAGATLEDIYELLTIHPESRKNYSRADFARDVFLLDTSQVDRAKSGARVRFVGATGVKGGKGFVVVPPDGGMPKHYYGVHFEEGD
jgi:hypothetical protein